MAVESGKQRLLLKLLVATASVIVAVVLGSVFSFWKIREARAISAQVVNARIPLLDSIRNIRQNSYRSTSSLKSYLLFGADPASAARYKKERAGCWADVAKAEARIRELEGKYDYGNERVEVDQAVAQIDAFHAMQDQVADLAVGRGGEATGKAYEMVNGELAAHEQSSIGAITSAVHTIQDSFSGEMQGMDRSSKEGATILWISTLLGALVGGFISRGVGRRIVVSVQAVVERAQAIAGGDLTGEALSTESNDEIADLAHGVNQMQRSLGTILRDMTSIAGTVHDASERLSDSTRVNVERTAEQSVQTRSAAETIVQLSNSINAVSNLAQSGVNSAQQAAATAREGGAIVNETLDSMKSIADSVGSAALKVQQLSKESEQIIHIVNVIEEIAAKTNLLALNATIEAARAGEQGRGFAVVAGEVRRLAESTHSATGEIARTVEGIRSQTLEAVAAMDAGKAKVDAGVATTARAGEALSRIIEVAGSVDRMVGQIASTAAEQANDAKRSTENLEIVSRLSAEAMAAVPETEKVVFSMEEEVKRLQNHVTRFHLQQNGMG